MVEDTINGLRNAASKANNSKVRDAMTALADDYSVMLEALDGSGMPDDLMSRVADHAAAIDTLCTVGA